MLNIWLIAAIGAIVINWTALRVKSRKLDVITKSLPVLFLGIWLISSVGYEKNAKWFFVGLLLSALGDAFLLFRGLFKFGLGTFFLTHIASIIGFNLQISRLDIPAIALLGIFAALWLYLTAIIRDGMMKNPGKREMRTPVILYSLVLCLMAYSAARTYFHPDWKSPASTLAICGALLFICSDFLLAVDRFVKALKELRLWKRAAYQLAQLAITAGAAIHFSS